MAFNNYFKLDTNKEYFKECNAKQNKSKIKFLPRCFLMFNDNGIILKITSEIKSPL